MKYILIYMITSSFANTPQVPTIATSLAECYINLSKIVMFAESNPGKVDILYVRCDKI